MTKYAPANDDGLKPFVVTETAWGKSSDDLRYAATAQDARYMYRTMLYATYKVRRATPEDVERLT